MNTRKIKKMIVKFNSTIIKEYFSSFKNTLKIKRNHKLDNTCNAGE